MWWRRRSMLAAGAVVAYVAVAALRAAPDAARTWVGLLLGPLVLLVGFRLVSGPQHGADRIEPAARAAARVAVTGAAVALVAELARPSASFAAARAMGVALAGVASLVALVRVTPLSDSGATPSRVRGLDAAALAALLWILGVGLPLARALAPQRAARFDPALADYAVVAASLGGMAITVVAAGRLFAQRRLEFGVAERAASAIWLTVLCFVIGVVAALMSVAPAERIVPLAALGGALCVTISAISTKPTGVSRALRVAVALTMLCAPLVGVAVVVAFKVPTMAGLVLFVVTTVAACLGLLAPKVADLLAPERGRWLRVLGAAVRAAKQPDPQQAVVAVLRAIRDGLGPDAAPAALYRLATVDRVVVDRAGYLHCERAEVPSRLLDLAAVQADRVLSVEALRYVQVRQPDVRPVVQWMDARGAAAAALVLDEDVHVGVLLWPVAGRASALCFEEVQQLRELADHLGVASGAAAQLARSRARELDAEQQVTVAGAKVAALRDTVERAALRHQAWADNLARPVRVACYSPSAQTAHQEAERLGALGEPLALVAAPGVDAVGWAAVVHLASPRRTAPLRVEDAAATEWLRTEGEDPLERWQDPSCSPLEAARGGTLVLLNAHALPVPIQRYLSKVIGADTGILVVLPATVDALAAAGRLDEHFADRLGDRALVLPALADRAEDLRALALHELAVIGIRLRGEPLGLSMRAQAMLNEYPWPGNDAELEAVLFQAGLATDGFVVDREQLAAALGPAAPADPRHFEPKVSVAG